MLAHEIEKQYGVKALGETGEVVDEYFAISVERRITHPCVLAITQSARTELFVPAAKARRNKRRASL